MSEILTAENIAVPEAPAQVESDNADQEAIDEWVKPLYYFVIANAEEVRPWSWMGGTEIRLGTAIWSYPNVNPDTVFDVISDITEQLAKKNMTLEEQDVVEEAAEEPNEIEEKKDEKPEPQKEPAKPEPKSESKPKETVPTEETIAKVVGAQPQPQPRPTAKESPKKAAPDYQKPAPPPTASEVMANTATKPAGRAAERRPVAAPRASTEKIYYAPAPIETESDNHQAEHVAEPRISPATGEPHVRPAPAQEPESPAVIEAGAQAETMPRVEPGEPIFILGENQTGRLAETEEITTGLQEEIPEPLESAFITSEPLAEPTPMAALNLEIIDTLGPTLIVEDELLELPSVEPELILGTETIIYELVERINEAQPQPAADVEVILDEIVKMVAKMETPNEEIDIAGHEPPADLEELLIELLETLDVDYSPKTIESLAALVIQWRRAAMSEKLKDQEDLDQLPEGVGTHEIIKKLLIGLNTANKTIIPAEALGKSALLLCAA